MPILGGDPAPTRTPCKDKKNYNGTSSNWSPSLLDILFHIWPSDRGDPLSWSKKQRRAFHRIKSGIYRHQEETLRFLTLTTSKDRTTQQNLSLNDCFKILTKRMFRLTPRKLIEQNYLSQNKAQYVYGAENLDEKLNYFEYFKVETSEGNGVLHILYYGCYYPQQWLSDNWKDITKGSYIIDIRQVKEQTFNTTKLTRYCINQYVSGQDALIRFSYSKNWCLPGFASYFQRLKKEHRYLLDEPQVCKNGHIRKYGRDYKKVYETFYSWIDAMAGREDPSLWCSTHQTILRRYEK